MEDTSFVSFFKDKYCFPSPVLPNVKEDQDWLTWLQIRGTFQCKSGPKCPTNPDQYNKIWLIPDFYENSKLFKHWITPITSLFYAHNYLFSLFFLLFLAKSRLLEVYLDNFELSDFFCSFYKLKLYFWRIWLMIIQALQAI